MEETAECFTQEEKGLTNQLEDEYTCMDYSCLDRDWSENLPPSRWALQITRIHSNSNLAAGAKVFRHDKALAAQTIPLDWDSDDDNDTCLNLVRKQSCPISMVEMELDNDAADDSDYESSPETTPFTTPMLASFSSKLSDVEPLSASEELVTSLNKDEEDEWTSIVNQTKNLAQTVHSANAAHRAAFGRNSFQQVQAHAYNRRYRWAQIRPTFSFGGWA